MDGYFPPPKLFREHADIDVGNLDSPGEVRISKTLLKRLISAALDGVQLDERRYGRENPDLETSLGKSPELLAKHFRNTGYFESRGFPFANFDPVYYAHKYPDVSDAVAKGMIPSLFEHYRQMGANEFRSPNAQSENAVDLWSKALLNL